jgi:hypothetical protein
MTHLASSKENSNCNMLFGQTNVLKIMLSNGTKLLSENDCFILEYRQTALQFYTQSWGKICICPAIRRGLTQIKV